MRDYTKTAWKHATDEGVFCYISIACWAVLFMYGVAFYEVSPLKLLLGGVLAPPVFAVWFVGGMCLSMIIQHMLIFPALVVYQCVVRRHP